MRHAASMAPDNATTISVIDFRRHSMVLQWHALGGTWTACDTPPALVHGIALIRASQPNICVYGHAGRLRLQVGPNQYALAENSPRIQLHPRLGKLRVSQAFHGRLEHRRRAVQLRLLDQSAP